MISRWAYLQNRLVYLTVAALMLYGLVSYFTLPAREDPHITIREALVEATAPGFTAERMERLVTRTLEEKIREVPEIEQLRSITQPGRTVIHVDILDKYFGLDDIWADVRNKVDEAERDLPEGVRMVRVNDDFGDVAVVTVALTGDEYAPAELFELAKYSRDRLFGVKGTKKVEMVGQREERAYIEIDEVRLPPISPRSSGRATSSPPVEPSASGIAGSPSSLPDLLTTSTRCGACSSSAPARRRRSPCPRWPRFGAAIRSRRSGSPM